MLNIPYEPRMGMSIHTHSFSKSFLVSKKILYICIGKQLALAQKKVIYIPMSRNVVREHFESGDMFLNNYGRKKTIK
ncbi:MAG: hypothetical protein ACI4N3_00845 [Alphaproteobacteria bacterium]